MCSGLLTFDTGGTVVMTATSFGNAAFTAKKKRFRSLDLQINSLGYEVLPADVHQIIAMGGNLALVCHNCCAKASAFIWQHKHEKKSEGLILRPVNTQLAICHACVIVTLFRAANTNVRASVLDVSMTVAFCNLLRLE